MATFIQCCLSGGDMEIEWMKIYKVKEDVAGFIRGDTVEVREICRYTPHVFVYGIKRGSGYIRKDLLEEC